MATVRAGIKSRYKGSYTTPSELVHSEGCGGRQEMIAGVSKVEGSNAPQSELCLILSPQTDASNKPVTGLMTIRLFEAVRGHIEMNG